MTLSSQKNFSKVENNNEQRINLKQKFRFLLLLFGDIVCLCVSVYVPNFNLNVLLFSRGKIERKILFIMFHHHHSLNIVFVFKNKTKNLLMFFLCFGHQKKKFDLLMNMNMMMVFFDWIHSSLLESCFFLLPHYTHRDKSWSGFSPFIFRILSCCCCCCCLNFNGTARKNTVFCDLMMIYILFCSFFLG